MLIETETSVFFFFISLFFCTVKLKQFCGDIKLGSGRSLKQRAGNLSLCSVELWSPEGRMNPNCIFPSLTFSLLASNTGISMEIVWQ